MLLHTPQQPGKITGAGRDRCRFDMFVRKLPGTMKPGETATWCHRGDKFTDQPADMLCNLLRMFIKKVSQYQLVEIYDNTRPPNDPERVIIRYSNGIIEQNRLASYTPMLERIALPDYLKP